MTVTAQYAQEHLEELLDSADRGESVEISREGKAKLLIVPAPIQSQSNQRKLGMGRGVLLPDFDEQWRKTKEEDERYFANHSLLTTGQI